MKHSDSRLYELAIARKEAYESETWLSLIRDLQLITNEEYVDFYCVLKQIIKILQSSIKTASKKLNIDN